MAEIRLSSNSGRKSSADGSEYKSPPAPEVGAFHAHADTDASGLAQHHTLGALSSQAAPGDHLHDGGSSPLLIQGLTVSGTRGSTAYYNSIEAILQKLGAGNTAV